jgi:hypothetical protein
LLTNYRMDVHGNLAMTYGAHDPGCCSLGTRALSLTMLGDLDQVEVALRTAVDLAYRPYARGRGELLGPGRPAVRRLRHMQL